MKNFIIPLVVYPFDVMISMGENDSSLFKKLRSTNVGEHELVNAKFDGDIGLGRYCMFECGASLIRIRNYPKSNSDFGNLQHEIFHAVVSVMWRIGMKLEIYVSDEAYAYLTEYLTTEIYKRI